VGTLDFPVLVLPLFAERREEHDTSVGCYPERAVSSGVRDTWLDLGPSRGLTSSY
jgi:hypothetical protein